MTLPMLPSGARLSFFKYNLPFAAPLPMGPSILESRTGFLIRCAMDGAIGWGEAAPLSGYSVETGDAIEHQLRAGVNGSIERLPPSLRCGLDFAIRNCLAITAGSSLCVHLGGLAPAKTVPTAKLITDDQALADPSALRHVNGMVKIKVGHRSLAEDIVRANRLMDEAGPSVRFRFDANRRWHLAEALEFARSIDQSRVEFIEEPLSELAEYGALDQAGIVHFALDESLSHFPVRELDGFRNLAAVVIKPTILGGVEDCRKYLDWARTRERLAVVSSAYETGVGMRNLIALAAALAGDAVAGLDTYSRLADDVATPRLSLHDGAYDPGDALPGAWQINVAKLEQIK